MTKICKEKTCSKKHKEKQDPALSTPPIYELKPSDIVLIG